MYDDMKAEHVTNHYNKDNKIAQFLHSDLIREMFPEHNDRTTDPNYRFPSRQGQMHESYSVPNLPSSSIAARREPTLKMMTPISHQPTNLMDDYSQMQVDDTDRSVKLMHQNQELLERINKLENDLRKPPPIPKKTKKKKKRKDSDSSSDSDRGFLGKLSKMGPLGMMLMRQPQHYPPFYPPPYYPPQMYVPPYFLPNIQRFEPKPEKKTKAKPKRKFMSNPKFKPKHRKSKNRRVKRRVSDSETSRSLSEFSRDSRDILPPIHKSKTRKTQEKTGRLDLNTMLQLKERQLTPPKFQMSEYKDEIIPPTLTPTPAKKLV